MDGGDFDFITPKALRSNIIESVEYATFLWILAQQIEAKYKDETLRTIILYNIAVIEALLLFHIKKEKITFSDYYYKHLTTLPEPFKKSGEELIVAYRTAKKREESRIWLHKMIKKQEAFLGKKLCEEIKDLQNIRNTFHLSRTRDALTMKRADDSFGTVVKLVYKLKG